MPFDWGDAGAGAMTGAEAGIPLDAATFGLASVVGGVAGGLLGGLDGKSTPAPYTDPNAASRQVIANNLLSAKTGEDYAAVQSAANTARGKELYGDISREWGGNPAVAGSMYNKVERQTEGENQSAGIEGARINEDNTKSAANILDQDSNLGFKEWQANTQLGMMPSPLESIATQSLGTLAGKGIAELGKTTPDSSIPPMPDATGEAQSLAAQMNPKPDLSVFGSGFQLPTDGGGGALPPGDN